MLSMLILFNSQRYDSNIAVLTDKVRILANVNGTLVVSVEIKKKNVFTYGPIVTGWRKLLR